MTKLPRTIIVFSVILLSCHRITVNVSQKMDADLRKQIETERNPIHFSGECLVNITPAVHRQIERTGIRIQTTTGKFFTALGTPKQIRSLARMEIILRMESAPIYFLKSNEDNDP